MSLFNCKLTRNISLSTGGGGESDGCNGSDNSVGVGGIHSPIYIWNISDIQNLVFSGDNRSDDSLFVDTVVTTEPFYSIDHSSGEYSEEHSDGLWSHSLTLTIANVNAEFEDLLADSVNGRYLVCFKPSGGDYRCFGWKYGAKLTYSMNISEDNFGYTVTITDTSEYPLLTIAEENFDVKTKVFDPIFTPDFSQSYCEQVGGKNNGYAVAMYVLKVNAAGQALDVDNKLCQWSGKKQDAYKLQGQPNGGYRIIGTYQSDAIFDGKAVRGYSLKACPAEVSGSITVNGTSSASVALNSTHTSSGVTVYSTDPWTVLDAPTYALMTPSFNHSGTTQAMVYGGSVGGDDTITLQNTVTRETVTVNSQICLIEVNSAATYPYGTTSITIAPTVYGGAEDYTYSVSPSVTAVKDGTNLILSPSVSSTTQTITVTLTHVSDPSEVKTVHITILGNNANPSWQILSEFCEVTNG